MHHLISASFRRSVQSCAVSRFVFTAIFVLEDGGLEPIVGDREGNEIQFASPETETKWIAIFARKLDARATLSSWVLTDFFIFLLNN